MWKRMQIRRGKVVCAIRENVISLYIGWFLYKTKLHVRTSAKVHAYMLVRAYQHIHNYAWCACACAWYTVCIRKESCTKVTRVSHMYEHECILALWVSRVSQQRAICVANSWLSFHFSRNNARERRENSTSRCTNYPPVADFGLLMDRQWNPSWSTTAPISFRIFSDFILARMVSEKCQCSRKQIDILCFIISSEVK